MTKAANSGVAAGVRPRRRARRPVGRPLAAVLAWACFTPPAAAGSTPPEVAALSGLVVQGSSSSQAPRGNSSGVHHGAAELLQEVNALLDKDHGHVVERLAFLGAGIVGLTGYFVRYCLDKRRERRLWRLDRISRQLEEFYGPLHYGVFAQQARFKAMLRMYSKDIGGDSEDQGLFDAMVVELANAEASGNVNTPAARLWMEFITEFAIPLNRHHAEILTTKGHLYDGQFPSAFKVFLRHAADLEFLAKRWEREDYSVLNQQYIYPLEMDREIERKLRKLLSVKAELLGSEDVGPDLEMGRGVSTLYMQSSMDPMSVYAESTVGGDGVSEAPDGEEWHSQSSPAASLLHAPASSGSAHGQRHSHKSVAGAGKGPGGVWSEPIPEGLPTLSRSAFSNSSGFEPRKNSCQPLGALCGQLLRKAAVASGRRPPLSGR